MGTSALCHSVLCVLPLGVTVSCPCPSPGVPHCLPAWCHRVPSPVAQLVRRHLCYHVLPMARSPRPLAWWHRVPCVWHSPCVPSHVSPTGVSHCPCVPMSPQCMKSGRCRRPCQDGVHVSPCVPHPQQGPRVPSGHEERAAPRQCPPVCASPCPGAIVPVSPQGTKSRQCQGSVPLPVCPHDTVPASLQGMKSGRCQGIVLLSPVTLCNVPMTPQGMKSGQCPTVRVSLHDVLHDVPVTVYPRPPRAQRAGWCPCRCQGIVPLSPCPLRAQREGGARAAFHCQFVPYTVSHVPSGHEERAVVPLSLRNVAMSLRHSPGTPSGHEERERRPRWCQGVVPLSVCPLRGVPTSPESTKSRRCPGRCHGSFPLSVCPSTVSPHCPLRA